MINIKSAVGVGVVTLATFPAQGQKQEPFKQSTPNIVIILMDDMGYGDIGRTGANQYETPNLNRFAAEGTQFTWYYTPQAVSSASRAGLMTGCYPNRVGIFSALSPDDTFGISDDETTIAQMLKSKGYHTGVIGKWHLGCQKEFLPLQHGFDEYFGLPYSNDMWPNNYVGIPIVPKDSAQAAKMDPPLPLIEGNEKIGEVRTMKDMDQLTTRYTEKAVQFIDQHHKEPFFLYIPQTMVHVPLGVSDKFKGKSKQGMYGDVMMEIDWSVGEVMKALKRNGLDKNTLVIFTSDNGPWITFGNHGGTTGGLREGKLTSWEGGQRVPCLMRWPGVIPSGEICNKITSAIDILPTLAAITGAKLPEKKIDGVNILPLLLGDKTVTPRRQFYYYFQKNSLEAVQLDYWKLILPHKYNSLVGGKPGKDGMPGKSMKVEILQNELYDLRRDPGERYNVADYYPDLVTELLGIAEEARKDLGDDLTNRPGSNRRPPGFLKARN